MKKALIILTAVVSVVATVVGVAVYFDKKYPLDFDDFD